MQRPHEESAFLLQTPADTCMTSRREQGGTATHPIGTLEFLDAFFCDCLERVEKRHATLDRVAKIRVECWVDKLNGPYPPLNTAWRKNRNAFAALLAHAVETGDMREPFDRRPPEGNLPTLAPHLRARIRQRSSGGNDGRRFWEHQRARTEAARGFTRWSSTPAQASQVCQPYPRSWRSSDFGTSLLPPSRPPPPSLSSPLSPPSPPCPSLGSNTFFGATGCTCVSRARIRDRAKLSSTQSMMGEGDIRQSVTTWVRPTTTTATIDTTAITATAAIAATAATTSTQVDMGVRNDHPDEPSLADGKRRVDFGVPPEQEHREESNGRREEIFPRTEKAEEEAKEEEGTEEGAETEGEGEGGEYSRKHQSCGGCSESRRGLGVSRMRDSTAGRRVLTPPSAVRGGIDGSSSGVEEGDEELGAVATGPSESCRRRRRREGREGGGAGGGGSGGANAAIAGEDRSKGIKCFHDGARINQELKRRLERLQRDARAVVELTRMALERQQGWS